MPQQALLQDFQESDLHRHVFMLIYKMYNRSYTRIAQFCRSRGSFLWQKEFRLYLR